MHNACSTLVEILLAFTHEMSVSHSCACSYLLRNVSTITLHISFNTLLTLNSRFYASMAWAYSSLLCSIYGLIMWCSISLEAINMSNGTCLMARKSVCTCGLLLIWLAKLFTSFATKGVANTIFTLFTSKLSFIFTKFFYLTIDVEVLSTSLFLFLLGTPILVFWSNFLSRLANADIVIITYKFLCRGMSLNTYYGTLT